ncbi:PIN domain-containing protein [Alicyclobacillus fastidiosus]|uniref:PIN domain-containing protein n=1 Tax=Alicyclobacillus fastidiosus TaxID=392011 RepID=A0ABY6ZKX2_9BACL|nr:PIN domain-containing protein [Alicyclobacillus fastidiosus]WAH43579.1 PIN domain-containing protein [Alicyclobacillus fastidiosus]GMA59760.1 hypothetical protein GCM10025859_02000 [Alicyclobacillus fastidiosus]GMA65537.1 hypothetical protein GCM10025859_59770 [Alicyclobacillus fastidiosus]
MAIQYTVRANVVDLRSDTPTSSDSFLVDTNVWYWMTYSNASLSSIPYQTSDYPGYIAKCLANKSKLLRCNLSFPEIAHIIERNELTIYNQTSNSTVKTKQFRHNMPQERTRVVTEIATAWGQVKSMAQMIEASPINELATDTALVQMKSDRVDGYDLFILQSAEENGVSQIITDDGDYCTIPNITIFTANQNVIAAASTQNKLIKR